MTAKKKASRVLVIDTCVVRSAGETNHPVSSACRNYLKAVLDICHHVALSERISEEWRRHQSGYARKWRCAMYARKKVDDVGSVNTELDLQNFGPRQQKAIAKDLFLLEAALAADKEIVSCDQALHDALGSTAPGMHLRDRITWRNPVTDGTAHLERT